MNDVPGEKRVVFLVEMDVSQPWSSIEIEARMKERYPESNVTVWGAIDGVDGAYRKLRQLAREVEQNALQSNKEHSAAKALSFFQDMFPVAFWRWKRIGGDHPSSDEKPMMAGR